MKKKSPIALRLPQFVWSRKKTGHGASAPKEKGGRGGEEGQKSSSGLPTRGNPSPRKKKKKKKETDNRCLQRHEKEAAKTLPPWQTFFKPPGRAFISNSWGGGKEKKPTPSAIG